LSEPETVTLTEADVGELPSPRTPDFRRQVNVAKGEEYQAAKSRAAAVEPELHAMGANITRVTPFDRCFVVEGWREGITDWNLVPDAIPEPVPEEPVDAPQGG
jgi:hypothetical protein